MREREYDSVYRLSASMISYPNFACSPVLCFLIGEIGGVVARRSQCQHRSSVGTNLRVETALESGST